MPGRQSTEALGEIEIPFLDNPTNKDTLAPNKAIGDGFLLFLPHSSIFHSDDPVV
jgi:hypothetical protein